MTSSDLWTAEVAEHYDERYADHFAPDVLGPTLDTLERLAEGGPVLELWVPPIHRMTPGTPVVPMSYGDDGIGFDTYDLVTQECTSQGYRVRPDGSVRHTRGSFRYLWPSECDLMARLAGMTLEHRWADWHGAPFTSTSENHVSVYRKALT